MGPTNLHNSIFEAENVIEVGDMNVVPTFSENIPKFLDILQKNVTFRPTDHSWYRPKHCHSLLCYFIKLMVQETLLGREGLFF